MRGFMEGILISLGFLSIWIFLCVYVFAEALGAKPASMVFGGIIQILVLFVVGGIYEFIRRSA